MNSLTINPASRLSFKKIRLTFVGLLTAAFLAACMEVEPPKSPLEIQAMQTREFDTSKDISFASTMFVFQDLGYVINTADKDTGLITAKSPTQQSSNFFAGVNMMNNIKATAFIEPAAKGASRIRLSFVESRRSSSEYGMQGERDFPIHNPEMYQKAFQKIQQAIFVRENV